MTVLSDHGMKQIGVGGGGGGGSDHGMKQMAIYQTMA